MITQPPPVEPAPPKRNFKKAGIAAAIIGAFCLGSILSEHVADGPRAIRITTHQLGETATLDNGTTIRITDIREQPKLFGTATGITVKYEAGPDGHYPTNKQPKLTRRNGETFHPITHGLAADSLGLDEPLAPGIEKTITLGYDTPITKLTRAQLNIDGKLFAGDFTERISNGR